MESFFDFIEQVHNKLLTLIAIILEFGALIWYVESLTYSSIMNIFYLINLTPHWNLNVQGLK